MGNINCPFVPGKAVHPLIDIRLRHRVQRRSGLIQHHIGRILVQASGNGHLLGLPAGQLHPILRKPLEQLRVQSVRQSTQPLSKACVFQGFLYPLSVIFALRRHIFSQFKVKDLVILEHGGKEGQVFLVLIFPDIHAIKQNLSLLGVTEPAQKFDKSGLAGAVAAHDGNLLSLAEAAADAGETGTRSSRIGKGHVPELEFVVFPDFLCYRQGSLRRGIGHIQIPKIHLHILQILQKIPDSIAESGDAVSQLSHHPCIFQNAAHTEGSEYGLCPHKQIHKQVKTSGNQDGVKSFPSLISKSRLNLPEIFPAQCPKLPGDLFLCMKHADIFPVPILAKTAVHQVHHPVYGFFRCFVCFKIMFLYTK